MNGIAAKSLPRLHCGKQQWRPASEMTFFFHMPYQLILIESFLWGIMWCQCSSCSFRRGCWRFLALVSHTYTCAHWCMVRNSAFAWVTTCVRLCVGMNLKAVTLWTQVWFLRLRIQVAASRRVSSRVTWIKCYFSIFFTYNLTILIALYRNVQSFCKLVTLVRHFALKARAFLFYSPRNANCYKLLSKWKNNMKINTLLTLPV